MPELIEVELYRRAAEQLVGRRIRGVTHVDTLALRQGIDTTELAAAITGQRIAGVRRHGKVLLVELADDVALGLRFGMTGRLVVDGVSPIEQLLYAGRGDRPEWDRLVVQLDRGQLRVSDPRRLGAVLLDPDLGALGPDATVITAEELAGGMSRRRVELKAALLDQHLVAGIGNLMGDDALWRARLSPRRIAADLGRDDVAGLRRSIRATIRVLGGRGGSHTGDLQPERRAGGRCPRCGEPLRRDRIGGRTTWWCPTEQR